MKLLSHIIAFKIIHLCKKYNSNYYINRELIMSVREKKIQVSS